MSTACHPVYALLVQSRFAHVSALLSASNGSYVHSPSPIGSTTQLSFLVNGTFRERNGRVRVDARSHILKSNNRLLFGYSQNVRSLGLVHGNLRKNGRLTRAIMNKHSMVEITQQTEVDGCFDSAWVVQLLLC